MSKVINNPFYQFHDESTSESSYKDSSQNYYTTQKDITSKFFAKIQRSPQIIKQQQSQFMKNSSELKQRILQANQRLKEFQSIASKTGLFNDQDAKLTSLLQMTKQDLEKIQKSTEELQQEKPMNEFTKSVIEWLQRQTIQLSNVFKKVLQDHTERVKSQEEKRNKFEGNRDRLIRRGGETQKLFLQEQNERKQDNEQNGEGFHSIQIQGTRLAQQKVTQMKKIESMLTEVAVVFQRLGTMVKLHETMIDRIDKYTDDSVHNVKKGRKELQEAYKKATENRSLIFKIFLVMFIFAFVYIIFI